MKNARKFYTAISIAEALTWSGLIAAMIAKYVFMAGDLPVRMAGSLHGFVFLMFVTITLITAVNNKWAAKNTLLGLFSSIIPFATLAFDAYAKKNNLLRDDWVMLREGYVASNSREKIVYFMVKNPIASILLSLIFISLLFGFLLWLGPPTQWGSRF